jgi:hypothetical protein
MSAKIAESVEVEKHLGWTVTVYRVALDHGEAGFTEHWTWAVTSAEAGAYGGEYPPTSEGRLDAELAGKAALKERVAELRPHR